MRRREEKEMEKEKRSNTLISECKPEKNLRTGPRKNTKQVQLSVGDTVTKKTLNSSKDISTFLRAYISEVPSPEENKVFLLLSTQHIKAEQFVNVNS